MLRERIALITLAACVVCFFLGRQSMLLAAAEHGQLRTKKDFNETTTLPEPRPPQDADGCYHVFIDVGANIGVHARFLLEPQKYPKARLARKIFDREFGTHRHNHDICTFEIEPNPAHVAAHERNAAAYQAMGWRYHFLPFAASDQDNTTLDFYHQTQDDLDKKYSEWGFTSSPTKKTDMVERIPSLRLSKWLQNHVIHRIIPDVPHGGEQARRIGPKIVMKMDIEGAEWTVLPDLITSGALCDSVDYLFGEFHNYFDNPTRYKNFYVPLQTGIHRILQASTHCKTKFEELDEEVYRIDGMPLPEPPSSTTT